MHDRIAELAGLRNELASCLTSRRPARQDAVGQVREQIARLRDVLETEAEAIETRAEAIAAAGQDVPAAQIAATARALRAALDQDQAREDPLVPEEPGPELPAEPFDPKSRQVDEIRAHLQSATEDEVERVLALEAAGKKRKSLLEAREHLLAEARARTGTTAGPDGPGTTTAAPAAPEHRTGDA